MTVTLALGKGQGFLERWSKGGENEKGYVKWK